MALSLNTLTSGLCAAPQAGAVIGGPNRGPGADRMPVPRVEVRGGGRGVHTHPAAGYGPGPRQIRQVRDKMEARLYQGLIDWHRVDTLKRDPRI